MDTVKELYVPAVLLPEHNWRHRSALNAVLLPEHNWRHRSALNAVHTLVDKYRNVLGYAVKVSGVPERVPGGTVDRYYVMLRNEHKLAEGLTLEEAKKVLETYVLLATSGPGEIGETI